MFSKKKTGVEISPTWLGLVLFQLFGLRQVHLDLRIPFCRHGGGNALLGLCSGLKSGVSCESSWHRPDSQVLPCCSQSTCSLLCFHTLGFFFFFSAALRLLRTSLVAQLVCLQDRRPWFSSWLWKIPWRKEWQPTPVFLPGEFHGQRSLAGYKPMGSQSWTQLSDCPPTSGLNFLVAAASSGCLWSCPGEVLLLCIFPAFRPCTPEGDIRILK